jgi:DNA-binding CsgD family transcriptional regulator
MNWYKQSQSIGKRWTLEDLQVIRELLEEGHSSRQIAKLFEVAHSTINTLNNKYNLKSFPKKQLNRIKPMEDKIKELYLLPPDGQGLSAMEVGRQLDISPTTVRKVIGNLGLDVRGGAEAWDDDRREQTSERFKKQWEDPEHKEMMRGVSEQYWNNPANRENASLREKARWEDDPTIRERAVKKREEYWANYPGGFNAWIQSFPPEKQKEILNAINAPN